MSARDEYERGDFDVMCAEIDALRRANALLEDDVLALVDEQQETSRRRHPSSHERSPRTSSLDDLPNDADAPKQNVVPIRRGGL